MIYRDRTGTGPDRNGTGMNRDEPVPVYRYQIMVPFRSVYRFNVSHPVPNTTGPERTGMVPERTGMVPVQPVPVPSLSRVV
ncbi:hypothetical protein KY290_005923 [Solanum tuberosum]|uniref:Uncharacterized protein n=1 Tax=Solanum tuberosum TaxID=4113 RepID=A0ABQ7WFI4_SOLTU|nr:hypothetical protein KY290_005923 [Solanum tuberosum]